MNNVIDTYEGFSSPCLGTRTTWLVTLTGTVVCLLATFPSPLYIQCDTHICIYILHTHSVYTYIYETPPRIRTPRIHTVYKYIFYIYYIHTVYLYMYSYTFCIHMYIADAWQDHFPCSLLYTYICI